MSNASVQMDLLAMFKFKFQYGSISGVVFTNSSKFNGVNETSVSQAIEFVLLSA